LHNYNVTNAHRVEVEVGADGRASAPPSRAAAVAVMVEVIECNNNRHIFMKDVTIFINVLIIGEHAL
jgi:hypothetical protein